MQHILRSYLKRLTNLSGNNRSLLLLKLISGQYIDLHKLDYLNDEPSFSILRQLISGKKKIPLIRHLDSRDEKVNLMSREILKLDRRDRFIFEERGAKDLYLGWPFVRGKLADGTLVRAPLLFFPCAIERNPDKWVLTLREEEEPCFNKSFLLAYAYFNKIPLSDDLIETSFDEFDKDIQVFLTQLYQLIKESPVELNFNQDLFSPVLKDFRNFKKVDFDKSCDEGSLILYPEAVLGIFPQAGSYLVPDYELLLENPSIADLEEFFTTRNNADDSLLPGETSFITRIKEEQTFTPFPLDAFQENAVKAVKKGNSLVVQGPPGTGKSQLICNLISDYISRGKKVLLVCQKRAALDVVYERLKKRELSDFIGLVHDFKNDRQAIYKQIASQIDRLEEYKFRNNSIDALNLERKFLETSRKIDQITEELEEFKFALFDEKECGVSIKELYLNAPSSAPEIDLHQYFRDFPPASFPDFLRKIRSWVPYANKFLKPVYIWNDRVSFAAFGLNDFHHLNRLLDEVPYYQSEISEKLREILEVSFDLEDCEWIADREDKVEQFLSLLESPESFKNFVFILNHQTDINELTVREKKILGCFKDEGLETSLESGQLGNFQEALHKAIKARRHPLKWIFWRLFSKDNYLIRRTLVANKLQWNREGLNVLLKRLDNRMNLEHNQTRLKELGWLREIPEMKDLETVENWFHHQHTALAAKDILLELRNLKEFLNFSNLTYRELKTNLLQVVKIVKQVPEDKNQWIKLLTIRQISKILSDYEYALELKQALKKDFDSLVEFDRLSGTFSSTEKEIMHKLWNTSNQKTAEEISALFLHAIRSSWIGQIETKYPVLRSVNSLKMQQMEEELQEAIEEKLRLSKEIVLMRTRERTFKYLDYNRLNNVVTYRDLKHQVTKKKKIWPVRKLISTFKEELFDLVPCWMASPEAVSAIFPMETIFDLVIFDEASQCFAERGVPGLYRGRQVVIAGDEKQLSPNDLYLARWEDEDDDTPELEVDSLLDLAEKYLMSIQLNGHYRSQTPDLIDFSNLHFYGGKLSLIPDFQTILKKEPAIRYIKTEGLWEKQSNPPEAEEICQWIFKLSEQYPEESIGVVTFNFGQQQLIQDLLDQKSKEQKKLLPSDLFVKNIENVQGDERDIIIFSTGYAPDSHGRLQMNFGSLNGMKGENRLNVAITRARKKIFVISSLFPEELKVDHSKHQGPKLLKAYLEYAWKISKGQFIPKLKSENTLPDSWLLKNKIKELPYDRLNFHFEEEVPFADLTVKEDSHYLGIVLTDDNPYKQSLTVKADHGYIPLALKNRNWKVSRIYSRQYWQDPEQVKEKLSRMFPYDKS